MKPATIVIAVVAALAGAFAVTLLNPSSPPPAAPAAAEAAPVESPAPDPDPAPVAPAPGDIPARERGFKDDFAALNAQRENVVQLPSGVQYEVLEAGNGDQARPQDTVLVRYEGSTADGYVFDKTGDDEDPARIRIEEITMPGLKEILLLMKEGDHWMVVIPPGQGFVRSRNNHLRRRDLIFDIRLVSVEPAS